MEHSCHQESAHPSPLQHNNSEGCHAHGGKKHRPDLLLWSSIIIVGLFYASTMISPDWLQSFDARISTFAFSIHELINRMWWGIIIGIIFVGILGSVPRELVTALLGRGGTFSGVLKATGAGVLLDLCSHGILMVAAKLYERGASLGQVMAFLIASPWNSLSLTLILWALVGFQWMITFLLLSIVIALISGLLFDRLVAKGILPANPHQTDMEHEDCSFWKHVKMSLKRVRITPSLFGHIAKEGILGSKMVLKWIFFGVILASLIRTFVSPDAFATWFGPSMAGLGLTILVATILEVCSEGSLPIAADLLTRASAPGNSFAFLMTGVSTDYTEILVIKESTRSWKIAFFLPLVTIPQVLILAWILNQVPL